MNATESKHTAARRAYLSDYYERSMALRRAELALGKTFIERAVAKTDLAIVRAKESLVAMRRKQSGRRRELKRRAL